MRSILLIPGPVSLSEKVRKAAVSTDLCHREPEFIALQDRVRSELIDVYRLHPSQWTAVLLGGSGTMALEAMLSSLLPRDARLLVLENGVYGERISAIAEIHGIEYQSVNHQWTDAIDFHRVSQLLVKGEFSHLAAVQHETTTGRLNDIPRLAGLCEEYGISLLLDSVSSFGAEAIPFDSPALLACAATANKCLHGIPGLCFVVSRPQAIDAAVRASPQLVPAFTSLGKTAGPGFYTLHTSGQWPAGPGPGTPRAERAGWLDGTAYPLPQAG